MAKTILIVDDEPIILKGLKFSLAQEGYNIFEALDGEQALAIFDKEKIDMILLDVMLPNISGTEVCQRIREKSDVPIIMLTAKGEDMDKILGLEYGADDYMTKPFNILEVKARIKSIFRRTDAGSKQNSGIIEVDGLKVNLLNRNVYLNGKQLSLTSKEFDLLHLFITNIGKVYSRDDLLKIIWKSDYSGDLRTVDVHIRRLREKIEEFPAKPKFILTKWGVGYYFKDN